MILLLYLDAKLCFLYVIINIFRWYPTSQHPNIPTSQRVVVPGLGSTKLEPEDAWLVPLRGVLAFWGSRSHGGSAADLWFRDFGGIWMNAAHGQVKTVCMCHTHIHIIYIYIHMYFFFTYIYIYMYNVCVCKGMYVYHTWQLKVFPKIMCVCVCVRVYVFYVLENVL